MAFKRMRPQPEPPTLPPPPHIQPLIGLISSCCNSCASEFPHDAAGKYCRSCRDSSWEKFLFSQDLVLSPRPGGKRFVTNQLLPLPASNQTCRCTLGKTASSSKCVKYSKSELIESHPHIWAPAGPGPTAACRSVHRRWDSCSCTPWTYEACRSWSAPCESAAKIKNDV